MNTRFLENSLFHASYFDIEGLPFFLCAREQTTITRIFELYICQLMWSQSSSYSQFLNAKKNLLTVASFFFFSRWNVDDGNGCTTNKNRDKSTSSESIFLGIIDVKIHPSSPRDSIGAIRRHRCLEEGTGRSSFQLNLFNWSTTVRPSHHEHPLGIARLNNRARST